MKPILLLALCCAPLVAQDPVRDWIAKSAVRLETPEAGHGFADMAGIGKIVGSARIVSLGEATHGTREFFQLKHRMMEYLATDSRKEPGVVRFDVLQVADDPTRFALYEVYRNRAAVDAHKQTAHYAEWVSKVEGWLAEPRTRVFYENIDPADESF